MKITRLETIRIEERPNLLWIQVHTDEGLMGLGETFFGAKAVEAYIHETVAPLVIGRNPLEIDRLSADLVGYLGFRSSGVETRGNSTSRSGISSARPQVSRLPNCWAALPDRTSAPTTPAPGPNTSRRPPARIPTTTR